MKKIILFHLLFTAIVVFSFWYFVFPDYLWLLEGTSFFTATADFARLQYDLPGEWASYAGAFLLQFFRFRVWGAAVQALFALVILGAADVVVMRLTRNRHLLWLSFIPVVGLVSGQFEDTTLARSLWWCAVSVLAALAVWCATLRAEKRVRGEHRFPAYPLFSYLLPCLLLGVVVYRMAVKDSYWEMEADCRVDRLVAEKKWDAVLEEITPEVSRQYPAKRRWALLALSEKGLLPSTLFAYGITSPADFLFERQDVRSCRNFNAEFYKALGFDNEVIHNAFQAGISAPYGMDFRTMRTVIDACFRQGNTRLLAKYAEVMRYTCCHKQLVASMDKFVASAVPDTSSVDAKAEKAFFIGARPFLSDMARVADRYPDHRKAVDYLLCGLLVSRDMGKFLPIFDKLYASSYLSTLQRLPRYYEEALLIGATQRPELLQRYPISREAVEDFKGFQQFMSRPGGASGQVLGGKYRDSFWLYFYSGQKAG